MQSPLHIQLVESGAQMAPYAGVETALQFADDATKEFRFLTQDCAVYDLGWRAKIAVTGDDRIRWLNGMVTNNIRDLAQGSGNYNFLLNAKGHILGDLYVYNRGDSLWIDTEQSQVPKLLDTLNRFIIMDDVELTDISNEVSGIAVQGPRAKAVLAGAGLPPLDVPPMQYSDVQWQGAGVTITQMESADFVTYEIWGAPAVLKALWSALMLNGGNPVGTHALEMFRVLAGVPKYGQDIREGDLPQETGQDHALNFTKGCYIGQEIVERIRSRGAVRRIFTGFSAEGGEPQPGADIVSGGKTVGTITSVERVPSQELGDQTLCLGYIRREALEAAQEITSAEGRLVPHKLPFAKL